MEVERAAPARVPQDHAAARGLDLAGLVPAASASLPALGAEERLPQHEAPRRRQRSEPHREAEGAERLRPPAAASQHGADQDLHLALSRPQLREAAQRLDQLRLAPRPVEGQDERALVLDARGPQARSLGQGAGGLREPARPRPGPPRAGSAAPGGAARGRSRRRRPTPRRPARPSRAPARGRRGHRREGQGRLGHPGLPGGVESSTADGPFGSSWSPPDLYGMSQSIGTGCRPALSGRSFHVDRVRDEACRVGQARGRALAARGGRARPLRGVRSLLPLALRAPLQLRADCPAIPGGSISSGRFVAGLLFDAHGLRPREPRPRGRRPHLLRGRTQGDGPLRDVGAAQRGRARRRTRACCPTDESTSSGSRTCSASAATRRSDDAAVPRSSTRKALDGHPTPATPFVRLSTGASGVGVAASLGLAFGALRLLRRRARRASTSSRARGA